MEFLKQNKTTITIILGLMIFSLSYWIDLAVLMIKLLSLLIIFEIMRTIIEYITLDEHRIKIRYVIEGAIIFGIREFFVGWVMIKKDLFLGSAIMILSAFGIWFFMKQRSKSIKQEEEINQIIGDNNEQI